jgi:hypothetical protein
LGIHGRPLVSRSINWLIAHAGDGVRVRIEGYRYGGVPEQLLCEHGVDALGQQERRACVPEIVKAYVGQPRPPDSGLRK